MDLDIWAPSCAYASARQPGERVGQPHEVLVAQRLRGEAGLDHGHQGHLAAGLERELEARHKSRPVEAGLGRGEAQPARAIDLLDHVAVVVELGRRRAERDRPDAADAQVAARIDDPARRVLAVELALALGAGEHIEDLLGPGGDQALEAQVAAHASPPTVRST
jgi:hypothetical protein